MDGLMSSELRQAARTSIRFAALALAAFGLYSVMTARPGDVEPMVVGHGLRLTIADPLTFGVVAALLATTALLTCWLPARRAARVHPMVALRAE
jgi:ABC-type lipoprotein release transport system permease subunit